MLLPMLRDGRLHLSAMAALVGHLTLENREAVLARATHATKREVEALIVELSPRPDVPTRIRRLPDARRVDSAATAQSLTTPLRFELPLRTAPAPTSEAVMQLASGPAASSTTTVAEALDLSVTPPVEEPPAISPSRLSPGRVESEPDGSLEPTAVRKPVRSTVETLSAGRYKVQFTASAGLRDKLDRLAALMRSQVPDRDLAAIIDAAVTEKLARIEARRFAKTSRPRKALAETDTRPTGRYVPAAVRRTVYERD